MIFILPNLLETLFESVEKIVAKIALFYETIQVRFLVSYFICKRITLKNNFNLTDYVRALKMYHPAAQIGTNSCSEETTSCPHLCFSYAVKTQVCKCAIGYSYDSTSSQCVGKNEFLLYSVTHELKGLNLFGDINVQIDEDTKVIFYLFFFSNELVLKTVFFCNFRF